MNLFRRSFRVYPIWVERHLVQVQCNLVSAHFSHERDCAFTGFVKCHLKKLMIYTYFSFVPKSYDFVFLFFFFFHRHKVANDFTEVQRKKKCCSLMLSYCTYSSTNINLFPAASLNIFCFQFIYLKRTLGLSRDERKENWCLRAIE